MSGNDEPGGMRRVGGSEYEMEIELPIDDSGMTGRECPDPDCSPSYFKVKPGTGITDGQVAAYCPYCRFQDDPGEFITAAQLDYAERVVGDELLGAVDDAIKTGLGLGPSGRKKFGGGMFSIELSYDSPRRTPTTRPVEEELRRDITCPECGLEHAVFGLAIWCPDCSTDLFLVHVEAELTAVHRMLEVVDERRAQLGNRVAARDIENALEDVVSIFEGSHKAMLRRVLHERGTSKDDMEAIFRSNVRNKLQNAERVREVFADVLEADLLPGFEEEELAVLASTFNKRHPVTHNLGVVDRRYLERARGEELEGRELLIIVPEVVAAARTTMEFIRLAHGSLFPSAASDAV